MGGLAALQESCWPADVSQPLRRMTLGDLLREAAQAVPDRIALVDAVADPACRRRWAYARFLADAERAAKAFVERLARGDRVAFCTGNCSEWLIVQHGPSLMGMVLVPINPAFRERELETILRDSQAAAIFYQPRFRDNDIEATLATLAARLPRLRHRISLEHSAGFFADDNPATPLPEVTPEDVVHIQFTSGTTGRSKEPACIISARSIRNASGPSERDFRRAAFG